MQQNEDYALKILQDVGLISRKQIDAARKRLTGQDKVLDVVQSLEASAVFPAMVVSMIDVGEETGQLPEMLLKIAYVYDDEVDTSVTVMTAALEPMMIVFSPWLSAQSWSRCFCR